MKLSVTVLGMIVLLTSLSGLGFANDDCEGRYIYFLFFFNSCFFFPNHLFLLLKCSMSFLQIHIWCLFIVKLY